MHKELRISVPCNWRYDLLNEIEENSELLNVTNDLYGAKDRGFTGSGRPFFLMPKKEMSDRESYINRVHDMGLKFTWLWNGLCVGYNKFNSEEQTKALRELDWLEDLGIEYLTVVDPYLAKFVKFHHPKINIKVSLIAEVNTISRALAWQNLIGKEGAMCLSVMANRNLPLLEQFTSKIDCEIGLLLNDACVNECPLRFFHYSETAHASQTHHVMEGFYNDWSVIACSNQKGSSPEQILMAKWIQPSDIDKYLELGIDYFKISGRRFATPWIINVLKVYAQKSYDGNLGYLLNGYNFQTNPLDLAGSQFSEYTAAQEKIGGYSDDEDLMIGIPDFDARLNCDKLDTFIEDLPYRGSRCMENCGITCEYCFKFVDKAYSLPSKEKTETYRKYISYLFDYINLGEMFVPKEERKLVSPVPDHGEESIYGVTWVPEAIEFLKETIELVPENMQKSAKKAISHITERTAQRQNKTEVSKDLIIGILAQLVPDQFKHDFLDFMIERDIDPNKYLSKEDITSIEKLPYSTDPVYQIQEKVEGSRKQFYKTKIEWQGYLSNLMKSLNELPELQSVIEAINPLILQYQITDDSNMDFWQAFENSKMEWGMGQFNGSDVPKLIHKTDFENIQRVFAGEANPIQETVAGRYAVEGETEKLMACIPLITLYAKAHAIAT